MWKFRKREKMDNPAEREELTRARYDRRFKEYEALRELKRSAAKTRLCRINAANRLLKTEWFLQGTNVYYSCFVVVLSILSLLTDYRPVAVWSVLISAILSVSVVHLNAQKYESRSAALQDNYLALHRLLLKIENENAKCDSEHRIEESRLKEYSEEYILLLKTSENHTELDNLLRIWKSPEEALSFSQRTELIFALSLRWAVKVLLISVPVVCMAFLMINGALKGLSF